MKSEKELAHDRSACLSMIDSFIAYYPVNDLYGGYFFDQYLKEYRDEFGQQEYEAMVKSRLDTVDHVDRDVFTDGDGVSYNTIIWIEAACN